MYLVTGNAIEVLIDAVKTELGSDATLMSLITGIYGHVPEASRAVYPYVKIGTQTLDDDFGAMQSGGGRVSFALDSWSNAKGPHAMRVILARMQMLLERTDIPLANGFRLAGGSLHCLLSTVFDEPDPDMPEQRLYHGHQDWTADVEEVLS